MRNNFDPWERVQDWFVATYNEKQVEGKTKVSVYRNHVNRPARHSELFVFGGKESDYAESDPETAFSDFMKEFSFYLRNYPQKYTLTIGNIDGGSPKRLMINVIEPGSETQLGTFAGVGGFSGVPNIGNADQFARLAFENYRKGFEIEQRDKQIEQLLTQKPDSRIGKLLDNLIDTVGTPEVINGLISTFQQLMITKMGNPVSVQSAGFVSPESKAVAENDVGFRSRFADYGETIKKALMNQESLVFNVMDNLVEILKSPEKVNALISYVHELNAVDGRFENNNE